MLIGWTVGQIYYICTRQSSQARLASHQSNIVVLTQAAKGLKLWTLTFRDFKDISETKFIYDAGRIGQGICGMVLIKQAVDVMRSPHYITSYLKVMHISPRNL